LRDALATAAWLPANGKILLTHVFFVSDKTEEQRAVESLAKSDRALKDYLRGLMAAVLNRGGGAR
jgi:HD superfamily phosphohydrolase YqeK